MSRLSKQVIEAERATAIAKGSQNKYIRRRLNVPVFIPYMVLIVLMAILLIMHPGLFSFQWLGLKTDSGLTMVLVGVGQTIVILTGGIDLSIGGILSLATVLAATQMGKSPLSILTWSLLIVLVGGAGGYLNGAIISYLRIQPFIATLATWSIFDGIALWILPTDGGTVPPLFVNELTGSVGGVPKSLLIILLIMVLWLCFRMTPLGTSLYAIGSSSRAAFLNGSNVHRIRIAAYTLSGVFAALAGLYLSAQTQTGSPTIGSSYILTSVATVVIGGTSLAGGAGGLSGTVLGVFILLFINDILLFAGISSYYTALFQGALLIFAVLSGSVSALLKKRRMI
ncbi:MAG: ABC transporter permease [Alicyclobacillus sp.]|nr:ABC transporter permease [Alicyclobacillus sp.]